MKDAAGIHFSSFKEADEEGEKAVEGGKAAVGVPKGWRPDPGHMRRVRERMQAGVA